MVDNEEAFEEQGEELFEGDTGTLPYDARRVVVALLRNNYISYERNGDLWPCLIEHLDQVKSSLNNLFLELTVDERNDIAFCMPPESADGQLPKLKLEHELKEIHSLLIVFLRLQYLSQISGGAEHAWVDDEEMREHLRRLYSEGVVNHEQSNKTFNSAIERMRSYHYIEPVKGSKDRYRILPIIETAFPLEKIRAVADAYEKAAGQAEDAGLGEAEEGSEQL